MPLAEGAVIENASVNEALVVWSTVSTQVSVPDTVEIRQLVDLQEDPLPPLLMLIVTAAVIVADGPTTTLDPPFNVALVILMAAATYFGALAGTPVGAAFSAGAGRGR